MASKTFSDKLRRVKEKRIFTCLAVHPATAQEAADNEPRKQRQEPYLHKFFKEKTS